MTELQLGPPAQRDALAVFPLLTSEPGTFGYQLLPEALSIGVVRIVELGEGSVPELLAGNVSDQEILVMDGEQLIGAKQNRTTSRSIILPRRSEVRIPVSCMEQGRWHHVSSEFAPSAYTSPGKVRRHARRTEASEADRGAAPAPHVLGAAQHLVWEEIRETAQSLGTRSMSGALNDYADQRAGDLSAWAAAFPWQDRQVGVLALLGGEPLALDMVGDPAPYRRVHQRLMMGYAMDALSGSRRTAPVDGVAESFLDKVRSARRTPAPTVGGGTYHVLSGSVVGAELLTPSGVVHLSAFPQADLEASAMLEDAALRPLSRRRRNRLD